MRIGPKVQTALLLAAALALTALVYWPGVSGGFVFDDYPNIVDNPGIHVVHSTLANWATAAWSSPASDLHRPLASLTFALNWYFTGSDPGPMKIVNIAIHLLNGVLLYFMLRELLRAWNFYPSVSGKKWRKPTDDGAAVTSFPSALGRRWSVGSGEGTAPNEVSAQTRALTPSPLPKGEGLDPAEGEELSSLMGDGLDPAQVGLNIDESAAHRLALLVAAAWLVLPINLMAVLYVVQRMESLCQVFVLAGLWAYLYGRRRMLMGTASAHDQRIGFAQATLGILLGTGLGLLSKESAVMLPVYAFLIECTLLGFASAGARRDRRVMWLFVFVLLLPAVLGLAEILPGVLSAAAWDGRTFTLSERLLTEARVLVKYLRWIIFPDPDTLSLYHDEMPLSTTLFSPWTTLPAIVFLAALLGFAVWVRKRWPLIALGILWFFAAQLLTGTVIPLELVYEHRNYFASIGVLLAVFSIVLGLKRTIALPIVRGALVAVFIMWSAGVTFLRAQDWSNPLRLALAEANRHPDSARATYEAGRLLIIATDYAPSAGLEKAKFYLKESGSTPGSSSLPEQALIMIAAHEHNADDSAFWAEMIAKLRNQPISQEDISALISLTQCRTKNDCHFDVKLLQGAFEAALSRPAPIARVYAAYADFAHDLLLDDALAIQNMRKAVLAAPSEPAYHVQLAHWLAIHGMTQEAVRQIDTLRRMNSMGRLDAQIAILEEQAERGGPALAR